MDGCIKIGSITRTWNTQVESRNKNTYILFLQNSSHLSGILTENARVIATTATRSQSFVNVNMVMIKEMVHATSDPIPCGYREPK